MDRLQTVSGYLFEKIRSEAIFFGKCEPWNFKLLFQKRMMQKLLELGSLSTSHKNSEWKPQNVHRQICE